jgi:hypothetical protein
MCPTSYRTDGRWPLEEEFVFGFEYSDISPLDVELGVFGLAGASRRNHDPNSCPAGKAFKMDVNGFNDVFLETMLLIIDRLY